MNYLPTLLIVLVCTCVSAQMDTTYLVEYPYQKKIMEMGSVKGVSVSLLQITKGEDKKKYCRIGTEKPTSGFSNVYTGESSYHVLFDKEAATVLEEKLNVLFVKAGSENAKLHTEYVDLISTKTGSLEINLFSEGESKPFTLQLDADSFLNRGRTQINASDIPKLILAIRKCLEMM